MLQRRVHTSRVRRGADAALTYGERRQRTARQSRVDGTSGRAEILRA
jgi:hypothetical protein